MPGFGAIVPPGRAGLETKSWQIARHKKWAHVSFWWRSEAWAELKEKSNSCLHFLSQWESNCRPNGQFLFYGKRQHIAQQINLSRPNNFLPLVRSALIWRNFCASAGEKRQKWPLASNLELLLQTKSKNFFFPLLQLFYSHAAFTAGPKRKMGVLTS